jgi:hypothetical protein
LLLQIFSANFANFEKLGVPTLPTLLFGKNANFNFASFAFRAELPTLTLPTLPLASSNSANFGLYAKS